MVPIGWPPALQRERLGEARNLVLCRAGSHRHRLAADVLVSILQPPDRDNIHPAAEQGLKVIVAADQVHQARPRPELDP